MSVKKIRLGYETFLLEKINQLERDIVLYQNNLDNSSSPYGEELRKITGHSYSSSEREYLRKMIEERKKKVSSKIEKTREEISKLRIELSQELPKAQYEPIFIVEREWSELYYPADFNAAGRFYIYQDIAYQVSGTHSDDECKLLVLEFVDRERRKFEQLKNKFSGTKSEELKYERFRIPSLSELRFGAEIKENVQDVEVEKISNTTTLCQFPKVAEIQNEILNCFVKIATEQKVIELNNFHLPY